MKPRSESIDNTALYKYQQYICEIFWVENTRSEEGVFFKRVLPLPSFKWN